MATEKRNDVLRRKARAGRDEHRARVMSRVKALRRALSRSADVLWDLTLGVPESEEIRIPHADLESRFAAGGLFLLLEGDDGQRGAAWLDLQLVAALIEMQTTGRVGPREAAARPLTRTDAAIAAPLVDSMLWRFAEQVTDRGEAPPRYRFGALIEDARTLGLSMEAAEFDLFAFTLDIADGAKAGAISVLLPVDPEEAAPEPDGTPRDGEAFGLAECVLEAPARLDAVIARMTLPLQRVCRLRPGDQLPIVPDREMETRLEAAQKHLVARARLGRLNGMRAVRLAAPRHAGRATAAGHGAATDGDGNGAVSGLGGGNGAPPATPTADDEEPGNDEQAPDSPRKGGAGTGTLTTVPLSQDA